MIYITLHNLHTWGKSHMTKAGDICVAASLANEKDDKTVHVAATSEKFLKEVSELYPDVQFVHFDAKDLTENDIVVVPILEFSRILPETRDSLLNFYQNLLKSDARLFIMNIHHNRRFYEKTIAKSEDAEIADVVKRLLEKCTYLVHDECMKLEEYNSKFIEQIVYFDQTKVKDIKFDDRRDIILTFYRPSGFKGFNLWLEETAYEKDHQLVAVCNVEANENYKSLAKEYEASGRIKIFESIEDYLNSNHRGHALISAPYSIETDEFQRLIKRSIYCLNTTDYNVLKGLNEGMNPDYLVLENAMFDAVVNGLPLRWTNSSIQTMPASTQGFCKLLNDLTQSEQAKVFAKVYDAKEYLSTIERMCR